MDSRSWRWGLPISLLLGCSSPPGQETAPLTRTVRQVERDPTSFAYVRAAPEPAAVPMALGPSAPAGPLLERAREAALRGDSRRVRELLEAKVRSGHGSLEEVRLLRQACKATGDRACVDDVRAKYLI